MMDQSLPGVIMAEVGTLRAKMLLVWFMFRVVNGNVLR